MAGSFMAEEIASQPGHWRRAAALAGEVGDRLPREGRRVAVVGCGTSWFIADSYAALREGGGFGYTDAFAVSEFPASRLGAYDEVLAITRSGTTTEVLRLLADLRGTTPTTVITGVPAAVADVADTVVDLSVSDERSVVQTRFATSTLALLRAHLGADIGVVADQAERVLGEPVDPRVREAGQFTFLGTGWTVGLANEAALKLREASISWSESYPAWEYRHGPISISEPGRVTWMFGDAPEGLSDEVTATGGTFVDDDLDPLADLVRAQLLAGALAADRGLDPDQPRNLSRSVVLG
ncbi:SIS domain-containing protein [Amycolatopsis suaedae]|uniref:Sugar isomerase n=1 Tax=Amycolatopsis suaedae TaxID=2510978 RepID=A0A4V2ELI9_9PSEU|nr:sugar isomerase [Amycolatopsis suaedae]RZQ61725.1 sugar isomerase [Amycolatopsis suaedae]